MILGRPTRWSFTEWALAVSAALAAFLGGLILHLRSEVAACQERLTEAEKAYHQMEEDRRAFRELEARKGRMAQPGSRVEPDAAFLTGKMREVGLTPGPVTPEEKAPAGSPWTEKVYTAALSSSQDQPIPREAFVRFLERIETEAPAFKSRDLMLQFQPQNLNDLHRAVVSFALYRKK